MATTPLQDFIKSQGGTEKAMPTDFGVKAPGDPVYVGPVSTPAEAGVDDQVTVLLFTDGGMAPATESPPDNTNLKDPVAPQLVSQSTGARPYPAGVLHAFPDDVSAQPGGGVYPPPAPPVTSWQIAGLTAANPTVGTADSVTDLAVGMTVSLSGDPAYEGMTGLVQAINGMEVTLGIDLSAVTPPVPGPATMTKV